MPTFDAVADLAISAIVTPPAPAASGVTLLCTATQGAWFPAPPFDLIAWPAATSPTPMNAKRLRVTGVAADTFTLDRSQDGLATARALVAGDQIMAPLTRAALLAMQAAITANTAAAVTNAAAIATETTNRTNANAVSASGVSTGATPISSGANAYAWTTPALAANATTGFSALPTFSATPTGAPAGYGSATPMAFNSSTGEIAAYTGAAWHGIGSAYSTMAPLPSGDATGATDYANLTAAIAATPTGARLAIRNGVYYVNAAVVVAKSLSIVGESAGEVYKSVTAGGGTSGPGAGGVPSTYADFYGVRIVQVTAATDVFQFSGSATRVDVENVVGCFAAAIANSNTGHVFNATPTQQYLGKPDSGLFSSRWTNVIAALHDGNHYGFVLVNVIYATVTHPRSYGGGGYSIKCDSAFTNYGNHSFMHPYVWLTNAGTAHGFGLSSNPSGNHGTLNLIAMIRPQSIMSSNVTIAATQTNYHDSVGTGAPIGVTLVAPDFEASGASNPPVVSGGTTIIGEPYITSCSRWNGAAGSYVAGSGAGASILFNSGGQTLVGPGAGTLVTSAGNMVAVGTSAGGSITTAPGGTYVGSAAGANVLGGSNVAVGWQCLTGAAASTAVSNVAVGCQNMQNVTTANNNVSVGNSALQSLTTGTNNVVLGVSAGQFTNGSSANAVTTGAANTFVGHQSGAFAGNISQGTTLGYQAIVGPGGLAIGYQAKGSTNSAIGIGYVANASGTNAIALGLSTVASAAGSVAIGADNAGTGASTAVVNTIKLGTALHAIVLAGAPTASAPAYIKGGLYFDTTLNKLRVGGASAWETVTSA